MQPLICQPPFVSFLDNEVISQLLAEQEKRHASEAKEENWVKYWSDEVIPNWSNVQHSSLLLENWWNGIPKTVRSQVFFL